MAEKMEIPRTKLVGMVKVKPSISIGRGINCCLTVEIVDSSGTPEVYEVIITRGRRLWLIKEGTKVCVVGILKGDTLWADYFSKY